MLNDLDFPDLLRLIDERSTAFRAAIAAAPSLDVQVPTCPEWTLFDLVQHLGEGRYAWAATVAAGPGATGKVTPQHAAPVPTEREAQLAWLAESTRQLLAALREAGPERGCWTWWRKSQSPQTGAAVARRQLHEVSVHTYDAQVTLGAPQPLPDDVALDGVEEFLLTVGTTTEAWPYEPAAVDYHAAEGRSWRYRVDGEGARLARLPAPSPVPAAGLDHAAPDASVGGTASDLVLTLYGRTPLDSVELHGSRLLLDRLVDWDPER